MIYSTWMQMWLSMRARLLQYSDRLGVNGSHLLRATLANEHRAQHHV